MFYQTMKHRQGVFYCFSPHYLRLRLLYLSNKISGKLDEILVYCFVLFDNLAGLPSPQLSKLLVIDLLYYVCK